MLATLKDLVPHREKRWGSALKSMLRLMCFCMFCAGLTSTQSAAEQIIFQPYANPLPAPEFALENYRGKMEDIRDYRGQVLLLNFSATW